MEEAKTLIEEMDIIAGNSDKQSRDRIDEIAEWFKQNNSRGNLNLLNVFIIKGIDDMELEIENIMKCIQEEKRN